MAAKEDKSIAKYAGICRELAELIGEGNMKKVYNRYCGGKVEFPKRIYSKDCVMNMLKKYEGKKSVSEMAQEFDYSERYIRKLMAEIRGEGNAKCFLYIMREDKEWFLQGCRCR